MKNKGMQYFDREDVNSRPIYKRIVVDDGFTEEPKEILDVEMLSVAVSQYEELKRVCEAHKKHKGMWLDKEVARKYGARSLIYRALYSGQYIKEMRELGEELQQLYGVTELEAINILNERNVNSYVNKYYRIKNLIPNSVREWDVSYEEEICAM